SGGSLRVSQHEIAPFLGRPLPSPAIRSLSPKSLNRTQVDPAHSVVLPAHTRVLPVSYFSCPAHTLVCGPRLPTSFSPTPHRNGPLGELTGYGDQCRSDCFAAIRRKRNRQASGYV